MKATTLYIPPRTDEFTGYVTFISMGTSTSDEGTYFQDEEGIIVENEIEITEEVEKEYIIPESREGCFMDESLQKFYQKKGYELKERP